MATRIEIATEPTSQQILTETKAANTSLTTLKQTAASDLEVSTKAYNHAAAADMHLGAPRDTPYGGYDTSVNSKLNWMIDTLIGVNGKVAKDRTVRKAGRNLANLTQTHDKWGAVTFQQGDFTTAGGHIIGLNVYGAGRLLACGGDLTYAIGITVDGGQFFTLSQSGWLNIPFSFNLRISGYQGMIPDYMLYELNV